MAGGAFNSGPVTFEAAEVLAIQRRVKLDSNAKLVYADGFDTSIGITLEAAAASGDMVGVQLWGQDGTVEVTAAGAFSLGATLYPAADGKVDDAVTGGGERFIALEAATANNDRVQAIRKSAAASGGEMIASATSASSAAGASSTSEVDFDVTKVIDASILVAGDEVEIDALVTFPNASNSTNTGTLKFYFGGVLLVTGAAVDFAANDISRFTGRVLVTTAGASGFVKGHGTISNIAASGTSAPAEWYKASTAQDLSGNVTVKGSVTMSGSHADNQAILQKFSVKVWKK